MKHAANAKSRAREKRVTLPELCTTIRSKQAGPYRLSFDILFKTQEIYAHVKASAVLTRKLVADLYHLPEDHITDFVYYDPGRALKITCRRPRVAGDPGDGDAYGCQQHAPLLGLTLDLPDGEAR